MAGMTLDQLLAAAGGATGDTPPCPFLPFMNDVRVYIADPTAPTSYMAGFQGEFSVGGRKVPATVLALRIGGDDDPDGIAPVTVFIAELQVDLDAVQWPIGGVGSGMLAIPKVQILFTSHPLDRANVTAINSRLDRSGVAGLPRLPAPTGADGCLARWMGRVDLNAAGSISTLLVSWGAEGWDVPSAAASPPGPDAALPRSGLVAPSDYAVASLSQVIGAVRVLGFGVGFGGCKLLLTFDVELTAGPLTFVLHGLGFSVSLDGDLQTAPRLIGAALDMDWQIAKLTAALVRTHLDDTEMAVALAGLGLVEIGDSFLKVQLSGFFGRNAAGWVSVFGYAEVSWAGIVNPVGYPPVFVVTGFALGGGVNSTLRVPTVKDVGTFPLVQQLTSSSGPLGPLQALDKLAGSGGWVQPALGQFWAAGGLQFTVFEFISARLLAVLEGRQDWKLMLIGTSTVSFPRNRKSSDKVLAQIVVDFSLACQFSKNIYSMDVALGKGSYVLDQRMQLTGGLSVYIWGDRGQFALSLGGYHPQYERPEYYPNPPRIGLNAQFGSDVTVRWEGYLAIVPNAIMAGTHGSLLYSKGGALKLEAWGSVHADFLVQWKPFYFDLAAGIRLGVAATVKVAFVRVRVSIEVGIDLAMWGPPIGGRVGVKLWFVTISFNFGASRSGAPRVGWEEYSMQLPSPISIKPEKGLELPDVTADEAEARRFARTGTPGHPLLASSEGFVCATHAALSANRITFNGETEINDGAVAHAAIRPMRLDKVDSVHHVTLTKDRQQYDPRKEDDPARRWAIEAYRQDMPAALWGKPIATPNEALNQPGTVRNRLAGLRFTIPAPSRGPHLGLISAVALDVEPVLPEGLTPLRDTTVAGPLADVCPDSVQKIYDTVAESGVAAERSALHEQLLVAGVVIAPGSDQNLSGYRTKVDSMFATEPLIIDGAR